MTLSYYIAAASVFLSKLFQLPRYIISGTSCKKILKIYFPQAAMEHKNKKHIRNNFNDRDKINKILEIKFFNFVKFYCFWDIFLKNDNKYFYTTYRKSPFFSRVINPLKKLEATLVPGTRLMDSSISISRFGFESESNSETWELDSDSSPNPDSLS